MLKLGAKTGPSALFSAFGCSVMSLISLEASPGIEPG
jgi:hypothetical protein